MANTEQLYLNIGQIDAKDQMKVERLRMVLGNKAKQETNFKFYSLYGHIQREDVLRTALKKVKANKGGPGIDGISIKDLDSPDKIESLIKEIRIELKEGTYNPKPVKRVYIPKANGKLRPLGIPTVKDRIIQMAALIVLEPIFEADFLDSSYGFRPGKSADQAIKEISNAIQKGCDVIYDADLEGYFDTIPHDKLIACLEMRIADRKVINLIRLWLKCAVMEYDDKKDKWKQNPPTNKGTPQGGVISPLLANLYLHWFDKVFHRKDGPRTWANAQIVRYADDFVILAKYVGTRITKWVEEKIENWLGLKINQTKSQIVQMKNGDTLNFLGYSFHWSKTRYGKTYLEVVPSKKSIEKEKEAIRQLTSISNNYMPVADLIGKISEQLRGWKEYFGKGNNPKIYRKMNYFIEQRIYKHLKKRSQRQFCPPEGMSSYQYVKGLGMNFL
jgi:RNA-directed DNA polymerase